MRAAENEKGNAPMKKAAILSCLAVIAAFLATGCPGQTGGPTLSAVPETKLCPGGTFPTGTDNGGEQTVSRFYIGADEVTWEQWSIIREWATSPDRGAEAYSFTWEGRMGSAGEDSGYMDSDHPVTCVHLNDAVVWCNALTEYCALYGFADEEMSCVYIDADGTPIRDSAGLGNLADTGDWNARKTRGGFRIPGTWEWECAARYLGTEDPGYGIEHPSGSGDWWCPGNFASGSNAVAFIDETSDENRDPNPESSCAAAWYSPHAEYRTHPVGTSGSTGGANALGLCDMSGNVQELCLVDPAPSYWLGRGGSWSDGAGYLQVGASNGITNLADPHAFLGFRVARSETIHVWGD